MIKGACLDFDGTLVDTKDILFNAWKKALSENNIKFDEEDLRNRILKQTYVDIIRAYNPGASREEIEKIRDYRSKLVRNKIKNNILFPETIEFLSRLKQIEIKVAIGSNMSRELLEFMIEKIGISKFIDAIVSADDVKRGKPAPDIFEKAFELLGISPKEGAVVGDTENDIIAGNEIGAFTIFISRKGEKLPYAKANVSNLLDALKYMH
ncbi:MAG: HAD family phosphatase [Candidatus Parvarchaeota archaeon]|nr:HAD family phosphatase [Candidatus Rehaiarchaeum fermentans]